MDVEGSDGGVNEFGQLDDSRLGNLSGSSRAIGGDGAVVAGEVGALQVAQACGAIART